MTTLLVYDVSSFHVHHFLIHLTQNITSYRTAGTSPLDSATFCHCIVTLVILRLILYFHL